MNVGRLEEVKGVEAENPLDIGELNSTERHTRSRALGDCNNSL
jgi:hypothetical protein